MLWKPAYWSPCPAIIKSGQVDQISELYEFATELGVQELSIWEGIPKRQKSSSPRSRGRRSSKSTEDQLHARGPRLFANTYFEGQMLGCMAGRRWMHVGVDGNIRACPYLKESYG